MTGAMTAIIAVLGTLLGSGMTFYFQRKFIERSESFTVRQQLRAERMTIYSDFGGALSEARRGQYDWWNRRQENSESHACAAARDEAYRLRGLAAHALFRVQMVAGNAAMIAAARSAYEQTAEIHYAEAEEELRGLGEKAKESLEKFLVLAAFDVQGDAAAITKDGGE